jgi:hypothetical protein
MGQAVKSILPELRDAQVSFPLVNLEVVAIISFAFFVDQNDKIVLCSLRNWTQFSTPLRPAPPNHKSSLVIWMHRLLPRPNVSTTTTIINTKRCNFDYIHIHRISASGASAGASSGAKSATGGGSGAADDSALEFLDPVDILKELKKDFWDGLVSKKLFDGF